MSGLPGILENVFHPTSVQRTALRLLKTGAKHILLFGGSRSGKTTILVIVIIYRAVRYAGSRHLICRLRTKDARSSVLHETMMPWLKKIVGVKRFKLVAHDNYVKLWNGSEIWIGGLGDKEQVDKILGHEYNTIYFNEVSQISYAAVNVAYSRLANEHTGLPEPVPVRLQSGKPDALGVQRCSSGRSRRGRIHHF